MLLNKLCGRIIGRMLSVPAINISSIPRRQITRYQTVELVPYDEIAKQIIANISAEFMEINYKIVPPVQDSIYPEPQIIYGHKLPEKQTEMPPNRYTKQQPRKSIIIKSLTSKVSPPSYFNYEKQCYYDLFTDLVRIRDTRNQIGKRQH